MSEKIKTVLKNRISNLYARKGEYQAQIQGNVTHAVRTFCRQEIKKIEGQISDTRHILEINS
jgi:hypothetical protein